MPNETEPQTNEVTTETTPTLDQFLAAVRADDAALAAEMPEPVRMWAAIATVEPERPKAIFATEATAWGWLFHRYGENDNFAVRPFMVSAAAVK